MDRASIDATLRAAVDGRKIPGIAAAAANVNGPIYEGAFGTRDVATGEPMALDTVIWIASMTKAITSVAALQLVERGRLSLDAPLEDVLPDLSRIQVLDGFAVDGTPRLRPPVRKITLKHLLTHSAGFGYDIWNADLGRFMAGAGTPPVASGRNAALDVPLTFDPGAQWQYGINIDWVGKAVEAVSGDKLSVTLANDILGPLGMNDTGFAIRPDMRARLARIHVRNEAGALTPISMEIPQAPEFEMGGGGLYSTVLDYLRFTRMLLGGGILDGARILSADMAARAMRNQIAPLRVTMMRSQAPGTSRDAEFFPGVAKSWGLIGMVNDTVTTTGRSAGSIAWAGLANTFWWVDAGRGLTGVIGTQLLPFADPAAMDLLEAYETALR